MVCMAGSDARTFSDVAMVSNTSRGCSLMRVYKSVIVTRLLGDMYLRPQTGQASMRSVPTQQIFFQPTGNCEDQQDHHQDQENQREHQSGVVGALRKREEVAEPMGRRHELAHTGARESKADRDFQIA